MQYKLYRRNPINALTQQTSSDPRSSLNTFCSSSQGSSLLLSELDVGSFQLPKCKSKVRQITILPGARLSAVEDNLFVGAQQLYSDKPQTTLKPGLLTFYSLHAIILNLSEKARSSLIVGENLVVAYLSVKCIRSLPESEQFKNNARSVSRLKRFATFHKSIERVLNLLLEVSVSGFECDTSDN